MGCSCCIWILHILSKKVSSFNWTNQWGTSLPDWRPGDQLPFWETSGLVTPPPSKSLKICPKPVFPAALLQNLQAISSEFESSGCFLRCRVNVTFDDGGLKLEVKPLQTDPTSCCRSELPHYGLNPGVFFTIWSGRLQPMTKETELCIFADAQCFSSVFFWGAFKSRSASVCSVTALVFIVWFFFFSSFQNAAKSRILLVHIKDLQLDFLNDHILFGFFMNSHVSIFFSLPCASEQLIQVLLRHAE